MANITKIGTIWSDLDHRLIQDAQGNLKKVVNVQSVYTSIDNILRTYKGERVMLPSFASNLKSILFESMNKPMMDFLSRDLKEMIEKWDDRVLVTHTRFLEDPDNNSIVFELSFVIKGYSKVFRYETSVKGEL